MMINMTEDRLGLRQVAAFPGMPNLQAILFTNPSAL